MDFVLNEKYIALADTGHKSRIRLLRCPHDPFPSVLEGSRRTLLKKFKLSLLTLQLRGLLDQVKVAELMAEAETILPVIR